MAVAYGPIYQGLIPNNGASNVPDYSPIYLEIRGEGGITSGSINISVNDVPAITNGSFQAGFTGVIFPVAIGFNVHIRPTALFSDGTIVRIHASATDSLGRSTQHSYAFNIAPIDDLPPLLIANPLGGQFFEAQSVELTSVEASTIYYTIDGSTPTTASPVYSAPIQVLTNVIIKFFAVDTAGNSSSIRVESYLISPAPVTSSSVITSPVPAGGTYVGQQFIKLVPSRPATIYYQINGDAPISVNNFQHSDAPLVDGIIIGQTDTGNLPQLNEPQVFRIDFFSIDENGIVESPKTATYTIERLENNIAPTNVFVSNPYIRDTFDICWDDLTPNHSNVDGYNVYRATNVKGKYERINRDLILSTFYRDKIIDRTVIDEDASSQFRVKTGIPGNLSFLGNIVDPNMWLLLDQHRIFYQNDLATFEDVYGNSRSATLSSKFSIGGNFELMVGFNLMNWPATTTGYTASASLTIRANKGTYLQLVRERKEMVDTYVSYMFVDYQNVDRFELPTTDLSGKFRALRVGSDISLFYWNGTAWTLVNSYASFSNDDISISIGAMSSDQPIKVGFGPLEIPTGEILLPFIQDVDGSYRLSVRHKPISSRLKPGKVSTALGDVDVKIDGKKAYIRDIDPIDGIITLETERVYDDVRGAWFEPPVPTSGSIVSVTYQYTNNQLNQRLTNTPYHYKVTCVLSDGSETRLSLCTPETFNSGRLDYMYVEAMRRNSWLLDQAGERVLLFIRKTVGDKARSYEKNERTHAQPKSTDEESWNTSFVGGYEGPFEIRIAPIQPETRINMTDRGLKLENSQETWTSMTPVITQRDFVLRRDGSIWAVGPVMNPQIRGISVQQHFSISYIDRTDIRYKFVDSLNLFDNQAKIGLRSPFTHPSEDNGIIDGIIQENDQFRSNGGPDFNDPKGRSQTFDNQLF